MVDSRAAPVYSYAVNLAACPAWQVLQHAARVGGHEGCAAPTTVGTAHGSAHRQKLQLVNLGSIATLERKNVSLLN